MLPEENVTSTTSASKVEERLVFFLVFIGVLALTYGMLFVVDFLPEKPGADTEQLARETFTTDEPIEEAEPVISESIDPDPIEIVFDALGGRTVNIVNPESNSVEALDTALLSGVVRHPDSADFARAGTIFLFGHSSFLPNVINKNFKAFNGIEKMSWGDTIRLRSSDTEYIYRVDRVYEASAVDAEVKIETGIPKLTLVTCDSFGSKTDRFIVEASLIEKTPKEMAQN